MRSFVNATDSTSPSSYGRRVSRFDVDDATMPVKKAFSRRCDANATTIGVSPGCLVATCGGGADDAAVAAASLAAAAAAAAAVG